MGNHKFRLSDMMPNAWFYKLKEIGTGKTRTSSTKTRTSKTTTKTSKTKTKPKLPNIQNPPLHPPPHPPSSFSSKSKPNPRKSYYFTRNVSPNSPSQLPRKSKSSGHTKFSNKSSTISPPDHYSASSSSYTSPDSDLDSFRSDRILPTESFDQIASDDIIINVDTHSLTATFDKLELSNHHLPPIITKSKPKPPVQFEQMKKKKKKESIQSSAKNRPISRHVNSPGLRLRVNSPRFIGGGGGRSRRIGGGRKSVSSSTTTSNSSNSSSLRSLSDSLAIVKSSFDPQRDFRESMVEMIVENNIRNSKDLEDLLACYLSLNADEYHQVIIKVFKQIWFDLTETPAAK